MGANVVTCSACRLVQPAAALCAACGQPGPSTWPAARVPAPRRPLIWRAMAVLLLVSFVPYAGVRLLVLALMAFRVLGGWLPLAAAAAALALCLAGRARRRLQPLPRLDEARATRRGVVRGAGPVTVDQLVDRAGRVILWRADPVDLEVATAAGEVVRVRGPVRVEGPAARPAAAGVADGLRHGVDPGLRVTGRAETITLHPGDEVELRAQLREEAVAAGYREPALAWVASGDRGNPVILVVTHAVDSRSRL